MMNTFNFIDYQLLVDSLSSEFFDDNGNYTPCIGRLNAMRLFYNYCLDYDFSDLPHNITEATDSALLAENPAFIDAFNRAISHSEPFVLSFANAYHDAMDIVETKKNSITQISDTIKSLYINFMNEFASVFKEENLIKLEDIVKGLIDDSVTAANASQK